MIINTDIAGIIDNAEVEPIEWRYTFFCQGCHLQLIFETDWHTDDDMIDNLEGWIEVKTPVGNGCYCCVLYCGDCVARRNFKG